jgi:hypothetical protein
VPNWLKNNAVQLITIGINAAVILIGGTLFVSSLTAKIEAIGTRLETVNEAHTSKIQAVENRLAERTQDRYTGKDAGKDLAGVKASFALRDERIQANLANIQKMSSTLSRLEAVANANQTMLVDLRNSIRSLPPPWLLEDLRELKKNSHLHDEGPR